MPDYSYAKKIIEALEKGEVVEHNTCAEDWSIHVYGLDSYLVGDLNNHNLFRVAHKPTLKPYSFETFPKGEVWLQIGQTLWLVTGKAPDCIWTGQTPWEYDRLLEDRCLHLFDSDGRELPLGVIE